MRRVLRGAQKVAKFGANIFRKYIQDLTFKHVLVNGEPGHATFYQGELISVTTFRTDGEKILDVFTVMNPDKLRKVRVEH
jgi:RNA polymerase sigma-70 factor (ECF subfamily)